MRDGPHLQGERYRSLDRRAVLFWQVENALGTLVLLALGSTVLLTSFAPRSWEPWILVAVAAAMLWSVLDALVLIGRRHRHYRYAAGSDVIVVEQGHLWRRRHVYPWSRVLYCETRQGPLLRWFDLYTVRAATIVDSRVIGPLSGDEAHRFELLLRERQQ